MYSFQMDLSGDWCFFDYYIHMYVLLEQSSWLHTIHPLEKLNVPYEGMM